jgi:hypothetical protein
MTRAKKVLSKRSHSTPDDLRRILSFGEVSGAVEEDVGVHNMAIVRQVSRGPRSTQNEAADNLTIVDNVSIHHLDCFCMNPFPFITTFQSFFNVS